MLRALIVDDEELARRGLEIRLASFDDIEICGQARNGREALAWGDVKLQTGGFAALTSDAAIFAVVNGTSLNAGGGAGDYDTTFTVAGGTISFQGSNDVTLTRTGATSAASGSWARTP